MPQQMNYICGIIKSQPVLNIFIISSIPKTTTYSIIFGHPEFRNKSSMLIRDYLGPEMLPSGCLISIGYVPYVNM